MSKKTDVVIPDKKVCDYSILYESDSKSHVDRLIELYKKDKLSARVIYHNNKDKYRYNRLVMFKRDNGYINYVMFLITYGMNKNGVIYHKTTPGESVIFKGNNFWWVNNGRGQKVIRPLNYIHLKGFFNLNALPYRESNLIKDEMGSHLKWLEGKYFWLKVLRENSDFHNVSFNKVVKHKLFGANDILKNMYGVALPVAKVLLELGKNQHYDDFKREWVRIKPVLTNLDKLTAEFYNDKYFHDTCKMSNSLGLKVNCGWGLKRLKEEHDNLSSRITKIVSDNEELQVLNIHEVYTLFAKYSGYNILRTNREMISEGLNQKHCVATYIDSVDRGKCGIYHVEGYTLQLTIKTTYNSNTKEPSDISESLTVNQFRGRYNESAPQDLKDRVELMVDGFNETEMVKYLEKRKAQSTVKNNMVKQNNVFEIDEW